jgi:hypothetical protein
MEDIMGSLQKWSRLMPLAIFAVGDVLIGLGHYGCLTAKGLVHPESLLIMVLMLPIVMTAVLLIGLSVASLRDRFGGGAYTLLLGGAGLFISAFLPFLVYNVLISGSLAILGLMSWYNWTLELPPAHTSQLRDYLIWGSPVIVVMLSSFLWLFKC